MIPDHAVQQMDRCLLPFLQSKGEAEAQQCLDHLFQKYIDPIVQSILKQKVGVSIGVADAYSRRQEDQQDLLSDIRIRLIAKLQEAKADSGVPPISDFRAYVAMTAYNAVNVYLRKKHPQRYSLKNKLSYLLQHQPGLALWHNEQGNVLTGFAEWRDQRRFAAGRLQQLLDQPQQFARTALAGESAAHMHPALLLAAVFNFVGHPVELDDLVAVIAELWGIQDAAPEVKEEDHLAPDQAQVSEPLEMQVVGRLDWPRYWMEIRQLPPKQCAALLLQAQDPDGNSLIELLEMEGIASLRDIAAAIDLPVETLTALWNDLPLEDAAIAERLGVTRQHVTRLRMLARQRIAQRLAPLLSA